MFSSQFDTNLVPKERNGTVTPLKTANHLWLSEKQVKLPFNNSNGKRRAVNN